MRGFELRRPMADLLEDGIYELRVRVGKVNYRILYFFHGRNVAILTHAMTKERTFPNLIYFVLNSAKRCLKPIPTHILSESDCDDEVS